MKIWILAVLLTSTFSLSDDCSIGTEGGNVFVEYDKEVEMAREEVIVDMFRDSAIVQCKFWFYNGAETKQRTVGFPNWWSSPPSASTALRDFRTWVDGKEVKVHTKFQSIIDIEGKDTLPDEDKEWFVWETKFKGKDTTLIENRYIAEYSRCNCTRENSVAYVLGTGRSWKSSIGKGKVTCSFGGDSAFSAFLGRKTSNQLREMRNEVFARNGFVFKDSALSILFSGKPWYAPNKGITASMIPIAEQKTVAEIKAIEDRK